MHLHRLFLYIVMGVHSSRFEMQGEPSRMTIATAPITSGTYRIEPVGDRCLLVRVGDCVGVQTSMAVHRIASCLHAAALPGVIDIVPAFTTVALHYLPGAMPRDGRAQAYTHMKARVQAALAADESSPQTTGRLVNVPACYGGRFGPDLEEVAERCKLLPEEVIARHTALEQVIYTFFFAPGNPFCGPVDASLQVPRRKSPRTAVPAGSVAIANGITTVYQTESPGGWNLIARTPWNLFDVHRDPPARLNVGDRVRFVPISEAEFDAQLEARA